MGKEAFLKAVRAVVARPFLFISAAGVFLVCAVADTFNPLMSLLVGLGSVTRSNPLTAVVTLIQLAAKLLEKPGNILIVFSVGLLLLVVMSIFLGFLLSGYLSVMRNTLEDRKKTAGEFLQGVGLYFSKMTVLNFCVLSAGAILLCVAMVSAVPAIITTRAGTGSRPELLIPGVFIALLTVAVLFFVFMFYRIYAFFMYPAVLAGEKHPFTAAKKAANKRFWEVLYSYFLFDLVFLLFGICFLYVGLYSSGPGTGDTLVLVLAGVLKWVFWTLFYSFFAGYVFSAYIEHEKEIT